MIRIDVSSRKYRFWPTYGLRSLLLLVALAAAMFAWYSHLLRTFRAEQAAVEKLDRFGAQVEMKSIAPAWIRATGLELQGFLRVSSLRFEKNAFEKHSVGLLTDSEVVEIVKLRYLDSLDLSGSRLSDCGMQTLVSLTNLQILDVSDTKLTDDGLSLIPQLPKLTHLYLADTNITDDGVIQLTSINSLEWVVLIATPITDGTLKVLQNMPRLRGADLRWTNVSQDGVMKLKHHRPEMSLMH